MNFWFVFSAYLLNRKQDSVVRYFFAQVTLLILAIVCVSLGIWLMTIPDAAFWGGLVLLIVALLLIVAFALTIILPKAASRRSAKRIMQDKTPSKPVLKCDVERAEQQRRQAIYQNNMRHREEVLRKIKEAEAQEAEAANATKDATSAPDNKN